jgi:hypothetical protein
MAAMRITMVGLVIGSFLLVSGCQTAPNKVDTKNSAPLLKDRQTEKDQDVPKALQTVGGALTGKELTPEELQELSRRIEKDPEAQSAVQTVTSALTERPKDIKYCPIDGKRFSARIDICPEHRVILKNLLE